MTHYTSAEVDAVHEFAWHNRDGVAGSGSQRGAMQLLDKIALAIAARAKAEGLRELADAMDRGERGGVDDWGIRSVYAVSLRTYADEIEKDRP